jgi:phage gp36-like protein
MYSTIAEVKSEASLTDNLYITDAEVTTKINNADAVINAYLSGKYTIPFTTPPFMIVLISTYLAAGYLLKKDYGPMAPGDSKDGDDKIKLGMNMLVDLQKGKITLMSDTGASLLSDTNKTTSSIPDSSNQNYNTDEEAIYNGPLIRISKKW